MKRTEFSLKVYIVISIILFSCSNINTSTDFKASKIKLINHSGHKDLNKSIEINDPIQINSLTSEFKKLKLCKEEVNVKSHFGFIEIIIYEGQYETTLGLINTKYDGDVFYNYGNNLAYKNGKLKILIENLMR